MVLYTVVFIVLFSYTWKKFSHDWRSVGRFKRYNESIPPIKNIHTIRNNSKEISKNCQNFDDSYGVQFFIRNRNVLAMTFYLFSMDYVDYLFLLDCCCLLTPTCFSLFLCSFAIFNLIRVGTSVCVRVWIFYKQRKYIVCMHPNPDPKWQHQKKLRTKYFCLFWNRDSIV